MNKGQLDSRCALAIKSSASFKPSLHMGHLTTITMIKSYGTENVTFPVTGYFSVTHSYQYVWPHLVMKGSFNTSKHIGLQILK